MYDVVIIGKGPAGISAALYVQRAGLKAAIIANGRGSLEKAEKIENYFGLEKPLSGAELQNIGENQAKALGADIIEDEVTGIQQLERFTVETTNGSYEADAIIITAGKSRKKTATVGLREFEGKGVSYCAVCDGFFYKGKKIAVFGNGDYALSEANHLRNFTDNITIFTDGKPLEMHSICDFKVDNREIERIYGDDKVGGIEFKDGDKTEIDGIFVAAGQASAVDFARKLGIVVIDGNIAVDENQMTNCEGVFAAGDCTGGLMQVSTSVGEGATAGQRASEFLRKSRK